MRETTETPDQPQPDDITESTEPVTTPDQPDDTEQGNDEQEEGDE